MLGARVQQAYVRAAGGQRVGKEIGRELNRAISACVRRGLIIEDDPLDEAGVKPKTYRTADQGTTPRELGPRTLEQIPPGELAELMRDVRDRTGHDGTELFRAVLGELGLKRLTTAVQGRLAHVRGLLDAERLG